MTDTTDDIAEDISFQAFEDDCQLLGSLLNDVLHREVGFKFVENVDRKRILAQVPYVLLDSLVESNAFSYVCIVIIVHCTDFVYLMACFRGLHCPS